MSFSTVKRELAAKDDGMDPGDVELPCTFCQRPTKRATLSMYGARCYHCYLAYQRYEPPERILRAA